MRVDIRIVPARQLTADMTARWRAIQLSHAELASPYFTPDYVQIVAAVRDDVEVALIERNDDLVAVFPFQREQSRIGGPVGGGLCDFQGLIGPADLDLNAAELMRFCGLQAWDFDHLLAGQHAFQPYAREFAASPLIDLRAGFEAYLGQCPSWKGEMRKLRKLERELGPLRFVLHSGGYAELNQILNWKSQQYLATGLSDGFAKDWVRSIVEGIWARQTQHFAGLLSLLYAGDRLVAGHIGMRAGAVMHWWFPAYDPDPDLRKYSPGLLILYKVAEELAEQGVARIDLGLGQEEFKVRMSNGSVQLARGSVELPSFESARRGVVRRLKAAVADSPIEAPLRRLMRTARRS